MHTEQSSAPALTHPEAGRPSARASYPLLEEITRPTVPTEQAAYYLARKPQTLRAWASRENGPIRPLRVHGRLGWPVASIKSLLGVA